MTDEEGSGPLVSLLVPVYNRSDLLAACLDSALAQTIADFEVIVVDGASTDDTWDVCLRYAAMDQRIRVFREAVNSGPVPGWWACVEQARGRYATFLWSDDLLLPTFLEETLPLVRRDDIGFAFTAAEIGPTPGEGVVRYAHGSRTFPSEEFISGSLAGTWTYPVSPACALFRLADIQKSFRTTLPADPDIDFTATGAGTDVLLYLLTATRYPLVASIASPLSFFRAHAGSITVEGRGGQVNLSYALAQAWFAQMIGRGGLARGILAREWISEMRSSHRTIRPSTASRRFHRLVSPSDLIRALPAQLLRKVNASVRPRIGSRP